LLWWVVFVVVWVAGEWSVKSEIWRVKVLVVGVLGFVEL
jgi:hypothetical protein